MSNLIPPHGGKGLTMSVCSKALNWKLKRKKPKVLKSGNLPARQRRPDHDRHRRIQPPDRFHDQGRLERRLRKLSDRRRHLLARTGMPGRKHRKMRPAINDGDEIALYDPEGDEIMATMKVTEKFELTDADKKWECEKVYMGEGTPTAEEFWKIAKEDHPGVQMVMGRNRSTWPDRSRCSAKATTPPSMPASTIARPNPASCSKIAAGAKSPPCSCATPCTAPTNICARSPWKCVTVFTSTLWSAT
jgi:sulfate adenylyltransferase